MGVEGRMGIKIEGWAEVNNSCRGLSFLIDCGGVRDTIEEIGVKGFEFNTGSGSAAGASNGEESFSRNINSAEITGEGEEGEKSEGVVRERRDSDTFSSKSFFEFMVIKESNSGRLGEEESSFVSEGRQETTLDCST